MSKIKGGIWCPRCAARVVKEGQCSGRRGPGKGRSPAAARAPLRGPGREGRRLFQRLRPPLGPRQLTRHIPPPKRHPRHPAAAHAGVLPSSTRLQRSEWAGQGFLSGQLSLSHRAGTGTEKPGFSRQPQPTTG